MKRPSQNDRIERRLMAGDRITQEDCDRMTPKIKRLAARIRDLKDKYGLDPNGPRIASETVKTPGGANVARYWLRVPAGGQGSLFGNPNQGRPG